MSISLILFFRGPPANNSRRTLESLRQQPLSTTDRELL